MPTNNYQPVTRTLRFMAYICLMATGFTLLTLIDGLPARSHMLWYLVTAWFLIGSFLALLGQYLKVWVGEFVGLPLLGTALVGFGLLEGGISGWTLDAVPSISMLWAFAAILFARWRDIQALYRASKRGAGR